MLNYEEYYCIKVDHLEIRNYGHSHTANVYMEGKEFDVFSFGDFGMNQTTYKEFKKAALRYIKDAC